MSYSVKLANFEGPFDLLVFLVEKNEMDIYDINIKEITNDYLIYIEHAKNVGINLSPEFLTLTATLMEIKSYMLLPVSEEAENDPENPKTKLQQKLVLYKLIKEKSITLKEYIDAGKNVKRKVKEDFLEIFGERDEILSLPTDKFIEAFSLFLDKKKNILEIKKNFERIERERESVIDKMKYIDSLFTKLNKDKLSFKETLNDEKSARENVLSFISILEMINEGVINIEQARIFAEIFILKLKKNKEKNNESSENSVN